MLDLPQRLSRPIMIFSRSKQAQKEEKIAELREYVREVKICDERARQLRLPNKIGRCAVENLARDFMARYHENVEERREILRQLLHEEELALQKELQAMQPTPETLLQEKRQKVEQLRAQTQREKAAEVQRLRELQFRENACELRDLHTKTGELCTQLEREVQIVEKQRALDAAFEETELFAEADRRQFLERELAAEEERRQALASREETSRALSEQLQELQKGKAAELEALEREKLSLRSTWQTADVDARNAEQRARELTRRLAQETRAHNELQREMKESAARRQKEEEKRTVQEFLERERQLKALEETQKERYREQNRQFWNAMRDRSNELATNQKVLDELLAREVEAQWEKRRAVWAREEAARAQLLKSVYDHRYEAIEARKERACVQRRQNLVEKERLAKELEEFNVQERQGVQEALRKTALYKEDLVQQISERHRARQTQLFEEAERERQRVLMEMEYAEKIEGEKRKAAELLEQLKAFKNAFVS